MFLLNLSLPEFLALLAGVSGVVVALYLLSRSRRRQAVATLRFWTPAKQPLPSSRRRRIQQPWSLILQLFCLALLLLALGQLKWGRRDLSSRDHVMLLDASSWMSAKSGSSTLIEQARARALSYLHALPSGDRIMLVRVDGLPSPVTGMENDRSVVERAIGDTRPGASALNLEQAFLFAEQIRRLHGSTGEIVYVGSPRPGVYGMPTAPPANLRVLEIKGGGANYGLARIGVRRSETKPEAWDVFVSVRNYDTARARIPLSLTFGGAPLGGAMLDVLPGATQNRTFQLRTKAAGWIEAKLLVRDTLEEDNRAILEVPEMKQLKVAVFTADPEAIRPALAAHPQIQAQYFAPSQYRQDIDAQVLVFDRFTPAAAPKQPTVWIEPPDDSPFRTRSRISEAAAVEWRSEHEIVAGIRTRGLRLESGQILTAGKGDVPFAVVPAGPVALLRPEKRIVGLGFHPGRSQLRYDLATPLLMANILKWLEPSVFRAEEVHGASVGTVTTPLDGSTDPKNIRVLSDAGELPFTIQGNTLRFFAGSPGVVRVLAGAREYVHSLSLPEIGDQAWEPPATVRKGAPGAFERAVSRDLWQILAVLGTTGLLVEWLLFGRKRKVQLQPDRARAASASAGGWWRKAS